MNYWLLTTEYPPLFGGGISTYCYQVAHMMASRGEKVSVFVPDIPQKDHAIQESGGVRVILFNPHREPDASFLGATARVAYAFAGIVREFIRSEGKPDFIEAQDYLGIAYYVFQFRALKYPEFQDIRMVLYTHAPAFLYLRYNREEVYRFPNYWTGEMEWSCLVNADQIISPSHYLLSEMARHGPLPQERARVIRLPYRGNNASSLSPAYTEGEIVFYGKLSPQKGILELLSYMKQLWDQGFPNSITLIGGTDKVYHLEEKTMGQVVEDKYADYIERGLLRITGQVTPAQRDLRLSSAQVIIVPSMGDNLPYAVIESMSIGKVVLASVQGGQAELIRDASADPQGTGFLFDHHQQDSFAEKLKHILSLDKDQIEAIGHRAAVYIRQTLNHEKIYAERKALLEQVRPISGDFRFTWELPAVTNPVRFARIVDASQVAGTSEAPGHLEDGLTVVIPYYNMGAYIEDCIRSIHHATVQPREILIINDGSTDEAGLTALNTLETDYKHIRVIHQPNKGLALTRNVGASEVRTKYMAFIDADDKVTPTYFESALRVLKAYGNVSFVGCWVRYFESSNDVWPTWNPEPPYILLHNPINSSALVYKTEAFLASGLNDAHLEYGLEDYDSVVSMVSAGYRGVSLPECLFEYRVRKGSMFRRMNKAKILSAHEYIADKHKHLYNHYGKDIYNLLNANGPSIGFDNPTLEVFVTSKVGGPGSLRNRIISVAKRNPGLKRVLLRLKSSLHLS